MLKRISLVLVIVLVSWAYQSMRPPPPKICGSAGGPPITGPRTKLRDGRHFAYKEYGVPLEVAKYKIIYVHAFASCRHHPVVATALSPEVIEELGVYIVGFDRPGYGESDPDPNRTMKSLALDIEELADHLGLGSKFYVIGYSMGGQAIWGCLKFIPNRLAGAGLIAPVINYWWPSFPTNMSSEAYYQQPPEDQWALRVAHYLPWLTYWWNTQKIFPGSSVTAGNLNTLSPQDLEILKNIRLSVSGPDVETQKVRQQGEFESVHRDMMVGFGSWEFDPMKDVKNPFAKNEGSVHLWQGDEDRLVPVALQRYIASKLPWIHYHELPGAGHLFPLADGMNEAMMKVFLIGNK